MYDALQALYGELDGREVGVLAAEGAPRAVHALGRGAAGAGGHVRWRGCGPASLSEHARERKGVLG